MQYKNRIKHLRTEAGFSQKKLANEIGISESALQNYEYGSRDLPGDVIVRLCELLNCTANYLLCVDDVRSPSVPHEISYAVTTLTAPVYGRIAAGDALEMLPVEDEAYVIPSIASLYPDGYFLTLSGDSMDKIMPDGSLVYIDRDAEVRSGDVAVVVVNGDDATIKRVFFAGDTLVLHPESNNPRHRDRSIDASDPDAPRVKILGKAVWHYLASDDRL